MELYRLGKTNCRISFTYFDHHSALVNTRAMINAKILDKVLKTFFEGQEVYSAE